VTSDRSLVPHEPAAKTEPAPAPQPRDAAIASPASAVGATTPLQVLALQRSVGNRAVGNRLLRGKPTAGADPTAPTKPFELGGLTIGTYAEGAVALRAWCADLDEESTALKDGDVTAPAVIASTRKAGREYIDLLEGGGAEPLDEGNADDLREWYGSYVKAVNAGRAAQATEAAARAKAAAAELEELSAKLEELVPVLREVQRSRFRDGDEEGLLETADSIATVLDTALVAKGAIEETLDLAADLRALAGTGSTSKTVISIASKTRVTLEVLEKINKAWAAFQLARAAVDLVSGSKTEMEGGRKGVAAMATAVSAGGTLLNASVGFTLYSNLYIGPMTSACLKMLARIEDMISKSTNRAWIELSRFDMVNWSLEPGGREMFDFMLQLMHASSSADVPEPRGKVDDYFVDNEDDFNAGVGSKGGELPTEGWWFWKDTDESRVKRWAFKNRDNLWGMLYGSAKVPTGRPEL
jgi:hypothetical protein